MLGDDPLRNCRGELDPNDGVEVLPPLEPPPDVQRLPVPALPGPETLDLSRVVSGKRGPEPAAERAPGRVVVDDERGGASADDTMEFCQARLAPRSEEVRPPGVDDVRWTSRPPAAAGPCPGGPARVGGRDSHTAAGRTRPVWRAAPRRPRVRPALRTAVGGNPTRSRCRGCSRPATTGVRAWLPRSHRQGRPRGFPARTGRGGSRCWGSVALRRQCVARTDRRRRRWRTSELS